MIFGNLNRRKRRGRRWGREGYKEGRKEIERQRQETERDSSLLFELLQPTSKDLRPPDRLANGQMVPWGLLLF